MKRIITCLLSAIISICAYAQFSDGFYRLQCKETGRYLAIHNSYVNKESAKQSGQIDLQSLETVTGFDNIVNDPGSVIYLRKTSSGYVIETQGFTTEGKNMYLQFTEVDGAYRVWTTITYEGAEYTRYLRDYQTKTGATYITTDAEKSSNWHWYIVPVEGDNYFGLKGDVKVGNSYYTTIYSAFPIQLGSGMKAYTVNSLTESSCTLEELGNLVPAKVPAVVACAGEAASANKVTPLKESSGTVGTNKLTGVIFCYPVLTPTGDERRSNPAWNCVDYKAATMRILGEADGKLAFITATDLKYMPANRAYLTVAEGSAATIPTDGTTGISRISSDSRNSRESRGTFTLNGTRLPDNVTPQKGIYIENGKKVVKK